MNKEITDLLQIFQKLNLPSDQYAIYGSGPLAIRGLREVKDLDVMVYDDLFEKLKHKHQEAEKGKIEAAQGLIEVFPAWNSLVHKPEQVIANAELIRGFKFMSLEDLKKWKKQINRDKDKQDLELIRGYLK